MFLLVLLTATMLIRPGEVFPDLEGLPFYLWIIATAILFNFERILKQLQTRSIRSRPMLASMLGILFAGFMSHLLSLRTIDAREYIDLFIRIVVFYLLLTGVVTTKYRLITMLKCVAFFSIIEVGMAVTDYLGYYDFPAIKSVSETYTDPVTHIPHEFMRMCGTGLFADPNDLCMLISVGATLCFYFMTRSFLGIFWAVPLGFLIYAITLTHSRGGLLSLVAAGITIFIAKFGWRKMTPLIVMAVPGIFLLGGRQTAITTGEGTGQSRVQLWSAGFTAIVTERSPCFGIGVNRYAEVAGQVAHNSFVQAYVETGFVGGTCFFALFYYGIVNLYRVKRYGTALVTCSSEYLRFSSDSPPCTIPNNKLSLRVIASFERISQR